MIAVLSETEEVEATVVETKEITGNTESQLKVYTNQSDITSIKITITKWSKGNAVVKLLKFFDMLAETYIGSDLQSFEVNEEMGSIDANYNLSSDTMTVSIYNKESIVFVEILTYPVFHISGRIVASGHQKSWFGPLVRAYVRSSVHISVTTISRER